MKLAKKHLKNQGLKNPTREEQIQELKNYEKRQRVIDSTLDLIYDEETTGHLPSDISDIVDRMRGRISGQGISNADIDLMIDVMKDWKDLKERAENISNDIRDLDYIDDGIENIILATQWQLLPGGLPIAAEGGKIAVQTIKRLEKKHAHKRQEKYEKALSRA